MHKAEAVLGTTVAKMERGRRYDRLKYEVKKYASNSRLAAYSSARSMAPLTLAHMPRPSLSTCLPRATNGMVG